MYSINSDTNNSALKVKRHQSTLVDLSTRFTTLNRPSSKEIAVFREQFYTLILNSSSNDRKIIADNLSRSEYVPKAITLFFAMEEIAIANNTLLYSPLLKSNELNLILDKCTIEHAKVIARRTSLDASNVAALLKFDDEPRQIYNALNNNSDLMSNVDVKALLDAPLNTKEWQLKSADVATHISVEATKPKISSRSKDLSASLLKLANKGGKLARKPVGKPAKTNFNKLTSKQIESQLLAAARFKDLQSFAQSVEHFCGLKHQTTLQLLENQNAGMLASLLCALEIKQINAARILLLLNLDIGRNGQVFKIVMKKYDELNREQCLLYFAKLGADFTQARFHDGQDKSTTRYALSLAARDRRAALLKLNKENKTYYHEEKLTA